MTSEMTFSEAIRKGAELVEPHPYSFTGCFLGMACAARGISLKKSSALLQLIEKYPILQRTDVELHCGCEEETRLGERLYHRIAHLFDDHVYGRRDMTDEQAIELIHQCEHRGKLVDSDGKQWQLKREPYSVKWAAV